MGKVYRADPEEPTLYALMPCDWVDGSTEEHDLGYGPFETREALEAYAERRLPGSDYTIARLIAPTS